MDSSKTNISGAGYSDSAGLPAVVVNGTTEVDRGRVASREVGALLIVSGIAGILLPGPVGTPLLILGCVMIWPKGFKPVQRFFEKHFPKTHRDSAQVKVPGFSSDLERRSCW